MAGQTLKSLIVIGLAAVTFSFIFLTTRSDFLVFTGLSLTLPLLLGTLFFGLLMGFYQFREPKLGHSVLTYILFGLLLFLFLITVAYSVILFQFDTLDIGLILSYLQSNTLGEAARFGIEDMALIIVFHIAILIVFSWAIFWLLKRNANMTFIMVLMVFSLIWESPYTKFALHTFTASKIQKAFDIDAHYKVPEIKTRPAKQKNLVIVFLESLEASFAHIPFTAEAMKPLTDLADAHSNFSNIDQVSGLSITIAGIVGSHCGVPFYPKIGTRTQAYVGKELFGDDIDKLDDFYDGVWCLSDQLKADGYNLSYMNGASLNRFSKRNFFYKHGYDTVLGYEEFVARGEDFEINRWGAEDRFLYDQVWNEFQRLADDDAPFALTMLTIATHSPDGYLPKGCEPPIDSDQKFVRAIECSVEDALDLVSKIKAHPKGDDTVIVLMSDHLTHKTNKYNQLNTAEGFRRNYMTVIDQNGARSIPKLGTMLDVYPTLLEVLGYDLTDDRANFGVSLFGSTPSLIEIYGKTTLSWIFERNAALSQFLWTKQAVQN